MPEVMDDPTLDTVRHVAALDALGRINRVSGTSGRVLREVLRLARTRRGPVRVLDVACGDGRVLLDVVRAASGRGVEVDAHGCDLSARAIARARAIAVRADVPLEISRIDVIRDGVPGGFDLVTCSLFLHHLTDADAVRVLRGMRRAARVVLVQDLRRTLLGFLLAWSGVRVLTRSDVARIDGPRSVRAAFTIDEVRALCDDAGMAGAEVRRSWPQRFTVRWEPA